MVASIGNSAVSHGIKNRSLFHQKFCLKEEIETSYLFKFVPETATEILFSLGNCNLATYCRVT